MATENILMDAVKMGGDRQELHEKIREYSMQTAYEIKADGKENTLLSKIASDEAFGLSKEDLEKTLDTKLYIGRSAQQCEDFVKDKIQPIIDENKSLLGIEAEIKV